MLDVQDEHHGERNDGEAAEALGVAAPDAEVVDDPVDGPRRALGSLAVAGRTQHVVPIERVGEILADEMPEQLLPHRLGHRFVHQRDPDRLAAADPREQPRLGRPELRRGSLDQLDRRQHLTVTRRLEEAHVGDVGVNHVHRLEIDAPAAQALADLRRHDDIGHHRDGAAVVEEESFPRCGARLARMIKWWLAIRGKHRRWSSPPCTT